LGVRAKVKERNYVFFGICAIVMNSNRGTVFSVGSLPRLYNEEPLRLRESLLEKNRKFV
jgi:hypothetical protein